MPTLEEIASKRNPGFQGFVDPALPWLFVDLAAVAEEDRRREDRRLICRSGCTSNPGNGWVRVRRQTPAERRQLKPYRDMLKRWNREWLEKSPAEQAEITQRIEAAYES